MMRSSRYLPLVALTGFAVCALGLFAILAPAFNQLDAALQKQVIGLLLIFSFIYLLLVSNIHRSSKIAEKRDNIRKVQIQRIRHQSNYDNLTQLPNRKMFLDTLHAAVENVDTKSHMFSLLAIDLDRFKLVNDSLGHDTGDRLLCEVAQRIQSVLRETDTVFRMGGDEFAVISELLIKESHAEAIAKRILDVMNPPFQIDDHEISVSCSIGVATYSQNSLTPEKLIKNADAAMYKAKEMGRNRYQQFTKEMTCKSLERLSLENDLRRAIQEDQFELFYQPKAGSHDGAICGMEALLRWQHPTQGLLTPDRFLSCLEDTGLIIPVGEWVIKTACKEAKRWISEGYSPMRISVNISSVQFRSEDLAGRIAYALEEQQLPAEYLELEITENILIEDNIKAIETIQALKKLGVVISIDDFGTGYSSLNYLKQYPIDYIKIDRSFIRDLKNNKKDAAITSAITNLAHSLDMQVVAEGVENQDQVDFLRLQGCQQLQGFLIGKPMPIQQMKDLVTRLTSPLENMARA